MKKYMTMLSITLLVFVFICSLPISTSTVQKEKPVYPLRVTRIPEELVEHPERANDVHPTGTIVAIDTTCPYKNWTDDDPLNEWHIQESTISVDIVLALDEEAIDKWGIDYAVECVERSDETFIYHYQRDFRVRAVVDWDSDDDVEYFDPDLYNDAYDKLSQYLGSVIDGHVIKAVIAVTGQETWDYDIKGLAPAYPVMCNNTLILCRFCIYFADDNLIAHEMGHLWNCPDHLEQIDIHCVEAYYRDYIWFVTEDGQTWDMFCLIPRSLFKYDWCEGCDKIMKSCGGSCHGPEHAIITGIPYPN